MTKIYRRGNQTKMYQLPDFVRRKVKVCESKLALRYIIYVQCLKFFRCFSERIRRQESVTDHISTKTL